MIIPRRRLVKPSSDSQKVSMRDGKIELSTIILKVIERCNLACVGCNAAAPLCIKSEDPSLETLKRDLEELFSKFSFGTLEVIGGEPFLYEHLSELLSFIKSLSPETEIRLYSNGSIYREVNPETLDLIKISKYRKVSINKNLLLMNKISVKTIKDFYSFFRKKANSNKLKERFLSCYSRIKCLDLWNSNIHICEKVHAIRKIHGLEDTSISLHDSVEKIYEYLTREDPLPECAYCYGQASLETLMSNSQSIGVEDWLEKSLR